MNFFNQINKPFLAKVLGGGLVVLIMVVIAMLAFSPFFSVQTVYAQDNFSLMAESEDSLGIDPKTSFIVKSRELINIDFLKQELKITPDIPFELKQLDAYSARISFDQALNTGQMVRFLLQTNLSEPDGSVRQRPYAWAFQVKNAFHVVQTIPGNKTNNVPLDAGVEVAFSHENVSTALFQKAFSINPTVEGTFQKNRRSLVFVPKKLEPGTVYTVTIASSLQPNHSSETLEEDYVFRFETSDEHRSSSLNFYDSVVTTDPTHKAQFQYGSYNYYDPVSVEPSQLSLTVYRFPSFDSFRASVVKSTIDSWRAVHDYRTYAPMDQLTLVGTFKAELTEQEFALAQIPVTLQEGYYGVLATENGQSAWFFVQSVTIGATVVSATDTSLVWAHDFETKKSLQGATVRMIKVTNEQTEQFEIVELGRTDQDGIARVDMKQDSLMAEVFSGDRAVLISLQGDEWGYGFGWWNPGEIEVDQDYWGYLYTDRPVYAQTDRVRVWGFLKSRRGDALPKHATLALTSWIYGYDFVYANQNKDSVEYAAVPVEIQKDGTFIAELTLPDMAAAGYRVGLSFGDKNVLSRSISVQEYRKPVYFLDLKLNRHAVIVGDNLSFTVEAKYFDGTPVAGKKISVSSNWREGTSYVLSEDGMILRELVINELHTNNVQATLAEPGLERAYDTEYLHVFPSSIQLEAEGEVVDNMAKMKVKTKRVEITDASEEDRDYTKNPRPNTPFKASVTQVWYEAIPQGEYYDFVRKTVQKAYRYEEHRDTIFTGDFSSDENGNAEFSFPTPRTDAYYAVDLSATDEKGRVATTSVTPYRSSDDGWYANPKNADNALSLFDLDTDIENPQRYAWQRHVNDLVRLEVQQNGKRFEMMSDGQFLFLQAQRGVQEYTLSNSPFYQFVYEERDVPNISAYAVLFTGTDYITVDSYGYWTSGKSISFDTETRKLDVTVMPNTDSVKPGGKAEVDVLVKDQDGKPVEAELNLSVVDEAYFSVFPDDPQPLESLYRHLPSGVLDILSSHRPMRTMGGAEGGGGGDGSVRANFVDTAAFVIAKTGRDGRAHVSLPLADNVTSWRVTTHAIDPNRVQAGVSKKTIATTLPFFINATVQPVYLTEDVPTILVTAAGTGVKSTDNVSYDISVENTDITASTEMTIVGRAHLPLPKLPEGTHKVIIKAKSGFYSDAVAYPVQVVRSRLTIPVVEQQSLSDVKELKGAGLGLTHVTFMDGNQGRFYEDLLRFAWRYGDRVDEQVARTVATELINETFDEQRSVPQTDAGVYQTYEGGLLLLPYAEYDPVLTAKVALLKDTPFDEQRMKGALLASLYATDHGLPTLTQEQAAWIFAGLSALDTPVLSEMKRFAQEETLSHESQLALAIAFASAGDAETARPIFQEFMKQTHREIGYAWFVEKTDEDTTERTAQLAILAAIMNEPKDRDALMDYLERHAKGQTLTILEKLVAIKFALRYTTPGASVVSYTMRGQTKRVELEKGRTFTIAVTPEELSALHATQEQGSVSVMTSYQKPLSEVPTVYNKIGVSRRYLTMNGQEQMSFKEGELIRVELSYRIDPDLPNEYFQVTDAIPSGLTPLTWRDAYASRSDHARDYCVTYPDADTDQTLTFFAYHGMNWSKYCSPNTIVYYARVLNAGTFKAEPASIRASRDPSLINYSNASFITLHE